MFVRKSLVAVAVASAFVAAPAPAAIISTPGLQSITFIEGSGVPSPWTFGNISSQMTTRLGNPLGGSSNFDFTGLPNEYYDVFYSDANGAFNLFGDFITIEARYPTTTGGGGLNISSVALNFLSGPSQVANVLASFVGLGTNFLPASVGNAVDGNPNTFTAMGNTGTSETDRLRVTVGFRATALPEPGTLALLGLGVLGASWFGRRRAARR
jgi:hypothetical protein